MICAVCGEEKDLCQSAKSSGIKQPRLCKECLMEYSSTGDEDKVNDKYWIRQLAQAGEIESLKLLAESARKGTV